MVRLKTHPNDIGLKFPRTIGRKKKGVLKSKVKESDIQAQFDNYLNITHTHNHRLPDSLMRWMFGETNGIPLHIKREVSEKLKGRADNVLFKPINDKYCLAMHVELKRPGGVQSKAQKMEAKRIPVNLAYSFDEAKKLRDDFEKVEVEIKQQGDDEN